MPEIHVVLPEHLEIPGRSVLERFQDRVAREVDKRVVDFAAVGMHRRVYLVSQVHCSMGGAWLEIHLFGYSSRNVAFSIARKDRATVDILNFSDRGFDWLLRWRKERERERGGSDGIQLRQMRALLQATEKESLLEKH